MRKSDWANILPWSVKLHGNDGFEWGRNDCALFVANVLQDLTGIDYAEPFRDKYTTEIGAARALKKYGAWTLRDTMTSLFGDEKNINFIMRGDPVYLETENGPTVGICMGANAAFVSSDGLKYAGIDTVVCGWGV